MSYNGYTNYQTWNAALWIDNEEGSYEYSRELARDAIEDAPNLDRTPDGLLALRLKDWIEEQAPDLPPSMFSDILQHALGSVDWHEIAENYIEEVREEQEA